jgi:hypothetical protein
VEEESLNKKAPRALRKLPGILTVNRDCPGSPGMSTSLSPFGAADRTLIRVYLLLFAYGLTASAVSKTRLWLVCFRGLAFL